MMLCQALMRSRVGVDYSLSSIVKNYNKSQEYRNILRSIMDNDHTQRGAFSIQNVAKMGLCHGKLPGEWYGPHAVTTMLKVLIEPNILGTQ